MRLGVTMPRACPDGSPLTGEALIAGARLVDRAAGGTRAISTNIRVDLDEPTTALADDAPFHLRCAPHAAAERLRRLADLGFDDAILVRRTHTEAALSALRALVR